MLMTLSPCLDAQALIQAFRHQGCIAARSARAHSLKKKNVRPSKAMIFAAANATTTRPHACRRHLYPSLPPPLRMLITRQKTRLTGAQWSFPLAFLHPAASDARKEHTRTPQQLSRRCRRRRGRCPFSAPEFEANATLMIGFFLRSQSILATETGPWAAEQGGCLHPGLLLRIPEAVPGIWPPPLPSGLEDPDPRLLSISPVID